MVVGIYSDDRRRVIQPYLYWPLVDALFPDHGRLCDPTPMSGMRVLDPALVSKPLPAGYGIETYLNLTFAAAGHEIATADIGVVRGPLRGYANVPESARAVTTEILDCAVGCGRLDADARRTGTAGSLGSSTTIGVPPPPGRPGRGAPGRGRRGRRAPDPPAHA